MQKYNNDESFNKQQRFQIRVGQKKQKCKNSTMMRVLAKDSKSGLGKRSGETVVEERACGSWYSWAAAKRWEMCFVWGAALPRGTIYWERDQQDNKFLSLYAHASKITKVDNERNPNGKRARDTEYFYNEIIVWAQEEVQSSDTRLKNWPMPRSLWPGSHTQKAWSTGYQCSSSASKFDSVSKCIK